PWRELHGAYSFAAISRLPAVARLTKSSRPKGPVPFVPRMPTADLRRRLVELNTEIIEQKRVLRALHRDRAAVKNELNATATFPILTLPVEITTEIFILCLPTIEELREDHRVRSDGEYLVSLQVPLSLASCCRLWRTIALATPSLWTTFPFFLEENFDDFGPSDSSTTPTEDLGVFIDRWIARAGALRPLTFVLSIALYSGDFYGGSTKSTGCVQDALRRYAHRLEHLDLAASVRDVSSLLELASVDFPLLRRVVIEDDEKTPYYYVAYFVDNFLRRSPQFRELFLQDCAILSSYPIPLNQLTRFKGRIDDLRLFRMAPNLIEVECSFRLSEAAERAVTDITHSSLQSLTLSSPDPVGYESISFVLDQLTLPALLSLLLPGGEDHTTPESVLSLLKRSTPPLRSLSTQVDQEPFDYEQPSSYDRWDECFSAVGATLENLDLDSPSTTFLASLLRIDSNDSDHDPLPHLKSLTLTNSPAVNYERLIKFLYRRSNSPALDELQSFRLVYSPGTILDGHRFSIDNTVVGRRTVAGHVRELERDGMDIQIESENEIFDFYD
ncbi:hypothetical protein B0H16DRAFT_1758600, partial [Mycena metata]